MSLYSAAHFRIYEPFLATIAKAWPAPTIFEPSRGKSISTLDSRLRICSKVLLANPTLDTTIDRLKWTTIADDLRISQAVVPGSLWCGPRSNITRAPVAPQQAPERQRVTLSVADHMPESSLRKLLDFISDGWCKPVTIFTTLSLEALAQSYDVQVKVKGPNVYQVE